MIIIFAIVATLITATVALPFLQTRGMKDFTTTEPVELFTKETLSQPPLALVEKLNKQKALFAEATEPVELTYTVEELNNAIRSYDLFSELQGTMAVKEVTTEGIKLDICFPMNHNPLASQKNKRYLVAVLNAMVAQKNDELILKVSEAKSELGDIPAGFTQHLQEYRVMQPYTNHPQIGRVMFGAQEIKHGDGVLTIVVDPQKFANPKAIKPAENNASKRTQRRFLMPLMSFLMVGGLFIFMVRRRNAKEAKQWKEQADRE